MQTLSAIPELNGGEATQDWLRCLRPQPLICLSPNASQSWLNFSLGLIDDSSSSFMTVGGRPPRMLELAEDWTNDGGGHGGAAMVGCFDYSLGKAVGMEV